MIDREPFIKAAWEHLKSLSVCPECGQTKENDITAVHFTGFGDSDCTHCNHPFHVTQYRRAVFETFDPDWVKRSYNAMYRYAVYTLKMGD